MSDLSPQSGPKRTLLRPRNFMSTRRRRAHIRAALHWQRSDGRRARCSDGRPQPFRKSPPRRVPQYHQCPDRGGFPIRPDSSQGCQGNCCRGCQEPACFTFPGLPLSHIPRGRRRNVAGRVSLREGLGRGFLGLSRVRFVRGGFLAAPPSPTAGSGRRAIPRGQALPPTGGRLTQLPGVGSSDAQPGKKDVSV